MDKLDIIIQKLESIESRLESLENRVGSLEAGQKSLEAGQKSLEAGQKSLEAGQKELYAMVSAIRHRQDETDAKLDSLALDVTKLYGIVEGLSTQFAEFREDMRSNMNRFDRHNRAIEHDLDRTIERLDDHLANRI